MARPVGLLYPDPILRQRDKPTGLLNVQAMRDADNREVLRGLLGPAYQQIEPFINAGAAIGDAFTEAPSEFASFGGVMPAWRQAGEHWQAGKYPKLWLMAPNLLRKACWTLSQRDKERRSKQR